MNLADLIFTLNEIFLGILCSRKYLILMLLLLDIFIHEESRGGLRF